MATINYTTSANIGAGYVRVEWPGMAGGDVGQAFDSSGLKLGSVQYAGNFNGGQGEFHASNEVSPATFTKVDNTGSAEVRSPESNNTAAFLGTVRPFFNGTGGSLTISAIFVVPR